MLRLPPELVTQLPPEIMMSEAPQVQKVKKTKAKKPVQKTALPLLADTCPPIITTHGVAPTTYGSSDGKVFVVRYAGSATITWD